MKRYLGLVLLWAALPLAAQDAAAVLNRYIQVTGGADLYKRYNSLHLFYTVTSPGKPAMTVDYFHTRDGKTHIETDTGTATLEQGVTDGVAWSFADNKADILTGKRAARMLAQSVGFDEDDWRSRYTAVALLPNQTIQGTSCRHLKLTLTDASVVERFYDIKSGLLIRESSTDFDTGGNEHPVVADRERYDSFLGIRRATVIHLKTGAENTEIQLNTVTYSNKPEAGVFELPHDVARALVALKTRTGGLPNPIDLIDAYVKASGGKEAYESIRSESIKAEASLKSDNLKFPILVYTAGGKQYSSSDIPSLGKFEAGDDGQIGWEKSVVLGPRLRPHAAASEFMGPEPNEVLQWSSVAADMETISQDQVNGTPCYLVRLGAKSEESSTACFDSKTNLLLKTTSPSAEGTTEQFYSDYRKVNGLLICHRIDTTVAGHDATVQIQEVLINQPLPSGVFDLPPDVRALKVKRDAASGKVPPAPDAPTLKRAPKS